MVRLRRRETAARAASASGGADWTQYVIVTPTGETEPLRKRRAILALVHALVSAPECRQRASRKQSRVPGSCPFKALSTARNLLTSLSPPIRTLMSASVAGSSTSRFTMAAEPGFFPKCGARTRCLPWKRCYPSHQARDSNSDPFPNPAAQAPSARWRYVTIRRIAHERAAYSAPAGFSLHLSRIPCPSSRNRRPVHSSESRVAR